MDVIDETELSGSDASRGTEAAEAVGRRIGFFVDLAGPGDTFSEAVVNSLVREAGVFDLAGGFVDVEKGDAGAG